MQREQHLNRHLIFYLPVFYTPRFFFPKDSTILWSHLPCSLEASESVQKKRANWISERLPALRSHCQITSSFNAVAWEFPPPVTAANSGSLQKPLLPPSEQETPRWFISCDCQQAFAVGRESQNCNNRTGAGRGLPEIIESACLGTQCFDSGRQAGLAPLPSVRPVTGPGRVITAGVMPTPICVFRLGLKLGEEDAFSSAGSPPNWPVPHCHQCLWYYNHQQTISENLCSGGWYAIISQQPKFSKLSMHLQGILC